MEASSYIELVDAFRANPLNAPLTKYPGVTRVLGGTKDMTGLNAWRARVGDEEADRIVNESRMIGSSLDRIFNDACDPHNQSSFDKSLYEHEVGYKLFNQLEPIITKIKPIAVQMKVWSENMQMMGYLDLLGIYKDRLTLFDCKNSKREKTQEYLLDYYLQCTAYSMMLYEMTGLQIKQIGVLVARRDSPFPQIEIQPIAPYIPEVLKRVKQYYALETV